MAAMYAMTPEVDVEGPAARRVVSGPLQDATHTPGVGSRAAASTTNGPIHRIGRASLIDQLSESVPDADPCAETVVREVHISADSKFPSRKRDNADSRRGDDVCL